MLGATGVVIVSLFGYCSLTPNLCLRGPRYRALPRDPLPIGDTIRLRAGGNDILYECDLGPPPVVRWRSTDERVLTVDRHGLVRAVGPGTASVVAWARLSRAAHELTVVPRERR